MQFCYMAAKFCWSCSGYPRWPGTFSILACLGRPNQLEGVALFYGWSYARAGVLPE